MILSIVIRNIYIHIYMNDTKGVIKKCIKVHGDKYDYSLVNYINSSEKIKIICPIHGIFEQLPHNHLNGNECPVCKDRKFTTNEFVKKSEQIHGDKYNYSLVNYINSRIKVEILCPIHGVFEQIPNNHLRGSGCKQCDVDSRKINIFGFIKRARELHGDKYDYSLVNYINSSEKIKIICPIHGIFKQTPNNHTSQRQGCPICKESKGENLIRIYLNDNNIDFIREYKFKKCRNKRELLFDFYLPKHNTCIEYDGIQHYETNSFFGGDSEFKNIQIRDNIKNDFCIKENINLIRIKYNDNVKEKLWLNLLD